MADLVIAGEHLEQLLAAQLQVLEAVQTAEYVGPTGAHVRQQLDRTHGRLFDPSNRAIANAVSKHRGRVAALVRASADQAAGLSTARERYRGTDGQAAVEIIAQGDTFGTAADKTEVS